ncbi:hypothetical protein [Streptomyces sp. NBC_01465]|uniref:hypothetical protein n=1 Tax=Streptomyces sp. NBC_01465 TaxID=2903878 RepID=UPI002E318640|nr:hypothetical protein [Streptomyces sp. NBC_01465]
MMQPQMMVERGGGHKWWAPGLISALLLPVWCVGCVVLNVMATLLTFGDGGCDDGSGDCMGPSQAVWHGTILVMVAAALATLISLLVPHGRGWRALRWSLAGTSMVLGLVVQVIAVTVTSH